MNRHLFPIANDRLAAALADELGDQAGPILAPLPGQTAIMRDGELVERAEPAAFVRPAPRSRWPARDYLGEGPSLQTYAPASGRRTLADHERALLLEELVDFARYLYGTPVFCGLHSLPHALPGARVPRLCLSLLDEAGAMVLVYDPSGARFLPTSCPAPIETFVSGLECWASDLLAYLRGEIAASALCYAGRLRHWNHAPELLRVSARELWIYGHPLRRPDRTARLYARLLAELGEVPATLAPHR